MEISIDELRKIEGNYDWYNKHGEGYRIVYIYSDEKYYIGAYSKTIEGFMVNFCDSYPIEDESDIPEFISIEDLLNRYIEELKDVKEVALYKTDGTCIQNKVRENNIKI